MKASSKLAVLLLSSVILLSGCSGQKKQVEYFKSHPEDVVTTMQDCIKRAMNRENIDHDIKCLAAIDYAKQRCEMMQKRGGIWFQQFNCNNQEDMIKFALTGM